MLLSLSKRLPVDQRKALSAKLRAVEQDTSVGPARKAEIARDFIAKAAKSLEAQRSMLEEQTHTEVDEVEAEAAQLQREYMRSALSYEAPCGSTQGSIWEIARNSEGYVD